ncbi:hypothetical protein FPCIR_13038 [Fusarium pseudocircinatum]|uniref:Uncharacterized protein n=1 Tax=Fusarium pseudocircinatum TaxID=56676 RepID=A0A8H5NTS0_9HYPO|nr:hypothetical protein FPCIR_13038 [Fusarium pseudocircinatum]
MVGFQDLPVELAVAIMKYVDTPQDISAMIHADPWLLHCLLDNRKQVMTPHTIKIIEVCESHVSTAYLLAARLRHIKQDPAFNDTKPQHREQIISPILQSCIRSHNTHHHVSHCASLSTICALSTLAIDVVWLTTSYISQAREELFRYRPSEDWPIVSFTERQKFINAACRFESYVQAFFHMEQPLFPRDESIRRLLFAPRLCDLESRNPFYAMETFYSIVYYIYDQHCTMMNNIKLHLKVRIKAIIDDGDLDDTQGADERQRQRLRTCGQIEVNKHVHYLTSEGLGMLLHLQSMDLDEQSRFVLSNFESVLDSRHPNVLMVHGIELYKIGTVEKHSRNPWLYCENVFEINPDQWQWAESFWDADGWASRWFLWW